MKIHKFFTGVYSVITTTYGEALTPLQKLELTYNFCKEIGTKIDTFTRFTPILEVEGLAESHCIDSKELIKVLNITVLGRRAFVSPKIFNTIKYCLEENPRELYKSSVSDYIRTRPISTVYSAFRSIYNIKPDESVLEKIKYALQFSNLMGLKVFVERRKASEQYTRETYEDFKEVTHCESVADFMYGIGCLELKGGRYNITSNALDAVRCCLSHHSDFTKK